MTLLYIVAIIAIVLILFKLKPKPIEDTDRTTSIIHTHTDDKAIIEEIKKGNKINAIKLYRELHSVGLKEAKEAVDKLIEDFEGRN